MIDMQRGCTDDFEVPGHETKTIVDESKRRRLLDPI